MEYVIETKYDLRLSSIGLFQVKQKVCVHCAAELGMSKMAEPVVKEMSEITTDLYRKRKPGQASCKGTGGGSLRITLGMSKTAGYWYVGGPNADGWLEKAINRLIDCVEVEQEMLWRS
jgi:hypothetical protein